MKTVFVSSTFKDMHLERDAIKEITAPLLNAEARKHGDEFDFCDLRWGINTSDLDRDESQRKVLDVCLDEIDRCNPPMVVLLGYRYGWIPDANLIRTAAERKHLEINDLERSVTALEIEYGALCDETKFSNTLFYFREIKGDPTSDYLAEDDEDKEKVLALKNRIKCMTGGRVKEYTLTWNGTDKGFDGVDAFAGMLAEDIKAMLMPEWEKTEGLTPFERERRTHNTFIQEKNILFRARQEEAKELVEHALAQPVTIIKGEVGSGKSTLFSHMAAELEKTEWKILPFISGLTMESNTAADIIEKTVFFIEEELHLDHYIDEKDSHTGARKAHTPDEWRNKLAEMCAAYAKSGKMLIIMLDAAEQLAPSEERDNLHFIPTSVSENIHFVMTCTMDFKTFDREYYTLRPLNDADKLDVIRGALARSGRELSKPVIDEMLKLNASDNPLYLSLLVQRLLMMNADDFAAINSSGDGMAAIEQHQLELIKDKCPDDLDEMSAVLLNEAGKRINKELISKTADYLAVSRSGLRKKDLAALLGEKWTEIDFSHFVNYMHDCFMLRDDGRYDFTHRSIRAGFCRQCGDLDGVNGEILEHFKLLEADDPVRTSEIIYHTIKADDKRFFMDYIIEYEYDDDKSNRNHAAKDVYAQCIVDNGKWFIDVLEEAKKYEVNEELSNLSAFCILDLQDAFSGSQMESEIIQQILSANVYFLENLYHKLKTNKCKVILGSSYFRAVIISMTLGSSENLTHALEMCKKGLVIFKQLAKESGTADSKKLLASSYSTTAQIYENLDGRKNLKHALKLYRKSHEIWKQLTQELDTADSQIELSDSYETIAEIYENLGGRKNHVRARKLYQKSLKICECLEKELGTADSESTLSSAHKKLAKMYAWLGDRENLERALDLYNKELAISEKLDKELGTADSRRDLAFAYNNVAGIYEKFGSEKNLEQALELYNKALKINEQLAEELGTADSKIFLIFSCWKAGNIYRLLGDSKNLNRALEFYNKAVEISEKLDKQMGNTESKDILSTSYTTAVGIYEELDGSENLKCALELCNKAINIDEQLAKELGTKDSRDGLLLSYGRAVLMYRKLGGRDNLEHALSLCKKIIKIFKERYKELGTAESERDLLTSYELASEIYEELGYPVKNIYDID